MHNNANLYSNLYIDLHMGWVVFQTINEFFRLHLANTNVMNCGKQWISVIKM